MSYRGFLIGRAVWNNWKLLAGQTYLARFKRSLSDQPSFQHIKIRFASSSTVGYLSPDEIVSEPPKKNASKKPAKDRPNWQQFTKKDPRQHILDCPDMYVGSIVEQTESLCVYDHAAKKLEKRMITFVPGLYKIFDEILVNAADNKQRDQSMTEIRIVIDRDSNRISVWNNGQGIPIVQHEEQKMLVPTLVFGHILTSSNYNAEEERLTGGRNGFGAKLTNVYSTKFAVETASTNDKATFRQEWSENMSKMGPAQISRNSPADDYTLIEFQPDLAKFDMESGFTKDIIDLMSRRALDLAGTLHGVTVKLNGEIIDIRSFEDYINLYLKEEHDDWGRDLELVMENIPRGAAFSIDGARWEVGVTSSPDREFMQCSFVNGIATRLGGKHVDHIVNQLTALLNDAVTKKNKTGQKIPISAIKQNLWVFINCLIVNPTFDSQLKDNMTLPASKFGSKFVFSPDFAKRLLQTDIVENILEQASAKVKSKLDKGGGTRGLKLKGIAKLEDANDAGTKNSSDCTLILTEGDSAKALVVSGFSVIGRDKYGVFPLRGKLLNVREASVKQLAENAEIQNIIKILGLKFSCTYEKDDDIKSLRYGRLMIMTDQDHDGSHIKGLLINFLHHLWPGLLQRPFLEQFITPIVKTTKGEVENAFYSIPEFEEWKSITPDWNKYRVKYFKGLGTSTSKEAKAYFRNVSRHEIKFRWNDERDDESIELAFGKDNADARKRWLTDGMKERVDRRERGEGEMFLYGKDTKEVTYTDFVNKELILFSQADNERSIPSVVDGLKPGQRKVLFTCLKRNDKREVKVAQLAGAVAENSAYHHGEVSLQSTIIGLAQDFVGSNNINLLMPCGQFGTRLQGGKDSASPRYIFTMLSPLAKAIFSPLDAPLLNYLQEDNQKIEPDWYIPVVPLVLINGSAGIGTGWMTKIPNYNPRDVVENLRRMLRGEPLQPMMPWFKGYRGSVTEMDGGKKYVTMGEIAVDAKNHRVEITELPVRTWTQSYKEAVIEPMILGSESKSGKAKLPEILDYREYHTDTTVRFVVTMSAAKFKELEQEGWHKAFKLSSSLSLSSMVLFDADGIIKKYDTATAIMSDFFQLRLSFYEKRRSYWLEALGAESKKLENQARFIQEKIDGKVKIENMKRDEIVQFLAKQRYDSDPVKAWKRNAGSAALEDGSTSSEDDLMASKEDFDYLMGMTFWKVSNEQRTKLLEERDKKKTELDELIKRTPADLWNADLDFFLEKLQESAVSDLEVANVPPGVSVKSAKQKGSKKTSGRSKSSVVDGSADIGRDGVNFKRIVPIADRGLIARHEMAAKDLKDGKAKGGKRKKVKEIEDPDERETGSESLTDSDGEVIPDTDKK